MQNANTWWNPINIECHNGLLYCPDYKATYNFAPPASNCITQPRMSAFECLYLAEGQKTTYLVGSLQCHMGRALHEEYQDWPASGQQSYQLGPRLQTPHAELK